MKSRHITNCPGCDVTSHSLMSTSREKNSRLVENSQLNTAPLWAKRKTLSILREYYLLWWTMMHRVDGGGLFTSYKLPATFSLPLFLYGRDLGTTAPPPTPTNQNVRKLQVSKHFQLDSVSSADSPEEQVITGQVPLTVIEHQHLEVTGCAPQLVTWPVDAAVITSTSVFW